MKSPLVCWDRLSPACILIWSTCCFLLDSAFATNAKTSKGNRVQTLGTDYRTTFPADTEGPVADAVQSGVDLRAELGFVFRQADADGNLGMLAGAIRRVYGRIGKALGGLPVGTVRRFVAELGRMCGVAITVANPANFRPRSIARPASTVFAPSSIPAIQWECRSMKSTRRGVTRAAIIRRPWPRSIR